MYRVSDNAINVLLKVLLKTFNAIVKLDRLEEEMHSIVQDFPSSLYSLRKMVNLEKSYLMHTAVALNVMQYMMTLIQKFVSKFHFHPAEILLNVDLNV